MNYEIHNSVNISISKLDAKEDIPESPKTRTKFQSESRGNSVFPSPASNLQIECAARKEFPLRMKYSEKHPRHASKWTWNCEIQFGTSSASPRRRGGRGQEAVGDREEPIARGHGPSFCTLSVPASANLYFGFAVSLQPPLVPRCAETVRPRAPIGPQTKRPGTRPPVPVNFIEEIGH